MRFGSSAANWLRRRHDALAHVEDVVAVLLVGGDEHRALALVAAGVAVGRGAPAHLGDVADAHDAPVDRGDDGVAHLVERGVAAGGLEREAARPEVDEARGNVRVLALHRADDLRRREVQLRHAPQVDRDAQLAFRIRPAFRGAHAVDGLELVLELARVVLELAIGRVVGQQRDLNGVDQPGRKSAHDDLHVRRELRPQRVQLARHLVVLLVGVGRREKLDRGERHAVADRGLHLEHVVERGETILDRLGDQPLQVLGIRARVDSRDGEARDLEVRDLPRAARWLNAYQPSATRHRNATSVNW